MGTTTIHSDWAEAPIVRFALDKAGPNADARKALCTLHDMMTMLEDAAPGVPFGEILQAWNPETAARGREAARKLIEQAGIDLDLLDQISARQDRIEQKPEYAKVIEMTDRGMTPKQITEVTGLGKTAVYRMRMRAGKERLHARQYVAEEHPRFEEIKAELLRPDRPSCWRLAKTLELPERLIDAVERHLVAEGLLAPPQTYPRPGRPRAADANTVIALLQQGLSHRQIAEQLGCSKRTVANIVKDMKP